MCKLLSLLGPSLMRRTKHYALPVLRMTSYFRVMCVCVCVCVRVRVRVRVRVHVPVRVCNGA